MNESMLCHCADCGHEWNSVKRNGVIKRPRVCPSCMSPFWERGRNGLPVGGVLMCPRCKPMERCKDCGEQFRAIRRQAKVTKEKCEKCGEGLILGPRRCRKCQSTDWAAPGRRIPAKTE